MGKLKENLAKKINGEIIMNSKIGRFGQTHSDFFRKSFFWN